MLKERRHACEVVKAAFLSSERTAESVVLLTIDCLQTMLDQRAALRLPIETGADALELVGESVAHATKAYAALAKAHPFLRNIPVGIGVADIGTSDSEENRRALVALRAVDAAAA